MQNTCRSFLPWSCFALRLDWGRKVETGAGWLAGAAPAWALTMGGWTLFSSALLLPWGMCRPPPFPSGQWFTSVPCYSPHPHTSRGQEGQWSWGYLRFISESAPKHPAFTLPAVDAPWRWWKVHLSLLPDKGHMNNYTWGMLWYFKGNILKENFLKQMNYDSLSW